MDNRRKFASFALSVIVAAGLVYACGDQKPNALDGTGSVGTGPCATPDMGCPCDTPGQVVECGKVYQRDGDYVTCSIGTRTCMGAEWGECLGDRVQKQSVKKSFTLYPANLGGSSACANPCDPYCNNFIDDPKGLDAGTMTVVDGALTNTGTLVEAGGMCAALVIAPTPTVTFTITQITPTILPAALSFTASLLPPTCYSGPVSPLWTVDRTDIALIDTSGNLRMAEAVSVPVVVKAYAGALAPPSTTVNVRVNALDTSAAGPMAGSFPVTTGAADTMQILYPYDGTVLPLGLDPPLLQWATGGTPAPGVKVTLRYPPAPAAPIFSWSAITSTESVVAPVTGTPAQPRYAIPKKVWFDFEQTVHRNRGTLGADAQFAVQRFAGGLRAEQARTLTFASGQLKGKVYYNSYGTNLATNYPGKLPSGRFGAATLAIVPGAAAPTVTAGYTSADISGCRVCHSVSAQGKNLLTNFGTNTNQTSQFNLLVGPPHPETVMAPADARYTWPALSPDGTYMFSNAGCGSVASPCSNDFPGSNTTLASMLYTVPGGAVMGSVNKPVTLQATMPVFSPNATQIAFNFNGGTAQPLADPALPLVNYVSTFAGSGAAGYVNGTGAGAVFNSPVGAAVDAAGNVYVADYGNNRIRKITPAGAVSLLAGSGALGGTNGTGAAASFNGPTGLAVDGAGTVFVAEFGGHRIRRITSAGVVTTLAGSGFAGFANGTGTLASFNSPFSVALDAGGNVYVGDTNNHRIRGITPLGVVTTLAGSGAAGFANGTGVLASFNAPTGVTVDAAGNVFVADTNNNLIRRITSLGATTTFAGSGLAGFADGTGPAAQFNQPWGLSRDAAGTLFVGEVNNDRIRRVTPGAVVTTFAGTGTFGATNGAGNGMIAIATFANPYGTAVDAAGAVYVADFSSNRIRKIVPGPQRADSRTLAMMDFTPGTNTFSNFRNLFSPPPPQAAVWPTFLPPGQNGVVFENEVVYNNREFGSTRSECEATGACGSVGTQAELLWVNTTGTPNAVRLAKANGVGLPTNVATGHTAALEPLLNYEPTMLPQQTGGYSWVLFTSRRLYGNVATINPYWSDPRFKDISIQPTTKKLWVAAIKNGPTPGTDPSFPAFYLPGQELLAGNSRGYWVLDACKVPGAPTAANVCDTDSDCCQVPTASVCQLDPPPLASPPVRHCVTGAAAACKPDGVACTSDIQCCGLATGSRCGSGVCAIPPPIYSYTPDVFVRDYIATCGGGGVPVWRFFSWQSITPTGTSIVFEGQTASSPGALAAAPKVPLGTAKAPPIVTPTWTNNGVTFDNALIAIGQKSKAYARVTAKFNPTYPDAGVSGTSPSLTNWRLVYDCLPAE